MLNRPKILVVEENSKVQRSMQEVLEKYGYSVNFASDVAAAVREARRQHPDLVLANVGLPAGGGMTVLKRFGSLTSLKTIPILMFSDEDPSEHLKRVFKAGAKEFISKHANESELIETIRKLLP